MQGREEEEIKWKKALRRKKRQNERKGGAGRTKR